MSTYEFDFNAIKKRTMKVTLPDEKKTVVNIGIPKKKTMDKFIVISTNLQKADGDKDMIDEIYSIIAEIFNSNTSGQKFTTAGIKKWMEFDDLIYFIKAYTAFINDATKN